MSKAATKPVEKPAQKPAQEEEEQEESRFIMLEELQNHGISAGDIKKMKLAGIHTVSGVLMNTKKV